MIIDKGGYQIFYGNPSEAIVYFKTMASYANAHEDQCITCGSINSDQLLQIIEAKVVNESGKHTYIRKVTPHEWAEKFSGIAEKIKQKVFREKRILPENYYSIPGLIKQSKIFFIRDLLSKLANRQYVMMNLLEAPALAFVLSYFIKYKVGGEYIFSNNENLTAYLFTCVMTILFLGLIISAEEIVKDRKILKRESFLNLSWFSYINSKVIIMFLISAIQTISFVLIGNFILEIKGMTFSYWFVFFTTSCLANMIGLNISSAFNSVITIYILIPVIIIPQLLFSGVFVKFDRLHQGRFTSSEFVPVIGEMMPARWSFEALAVEQFKNNKYGKIFFNYNLEISQNDWYSIFLYDILKVDLKKCQMYKDSLSYRQMVKDDFYKLNYYIDKLNGLAGFGPIGGDWKASLNIENFNSEVFKDAGNYLDSLSGQFRKVRKKYSDRKDSVNKSIEANRRDEFMKLQNDYSNTNLEDVILNRLRVDKSIETARRIIQKYEPGYMKPTSKYGRSHFYAPYKQIGNIIIDTYWFNLLVLWIGSLLLYLALYYNLLQKLVTRLENLRLKGSGK
jgi:ABC-2 type transporter.